MQMQASRGDWVQIHLVVLEAGKRAPQVPEDTALVPLEMKVKGCLVEESAAVGDTVSVRTAVGREIKGKLIAVDPPYEVGYGPPPVELRQVGSELREILKREGA